MFCTAHEQGIRCPHRAHSTDQAVTHETVASTQHSSELITVPACRDNVQHNCTLDFSCEFSSDVDLLGPAVEGNIFIDCGNIECINNGVGYVGAVADCHTIPKNATTFSASTGDRKLSNACGFEVDADAINVCYVSSDSASEYIPPEESESAVENSCGKQTLLLTRNHL